MFQTNQIVRGHVAGTFVILGFRTIHGIDYAQVKQVDPNTGEAYPGEMALPLSALREIESNDDMCGRWGGERAPPEART